MSTSPSVIDTRRDQMFPVLEPFEIERLRRFGKVRLYDAGAALSFLPCDVLPLMAPNRSVDPNPLLAPAAADPLLALLRGWLMDPLPGFQFTLLAQEAHAVTSLDFKHTT